MYYVIDPNSSRRAVLETGLHSFDLEVSGFSTINQFLDVVDRSTPGVIIFAMPPSIGERDQGLSTLLSDREMYPVVVLASNGTVDMCRHVLKSGAKEFLTYPICWPELLACLRQCLNDDQNTRASLCGQPDCEQVGNLTQREREIMELIMAGATSKEIAWNLNLSRRTVDAHRARIRGKLKGRTFSQVVRIYLTSGASLSST